MSKKITTCKTCGNEIAKSAKTCPSCGAKNKKPLLKKPIFWVLIIIVIAVIGLVGGSGSEPEIDYTTPDFVVTADEIMSEFNENSVAAQEKYGGKVITVSGKISSISEYTIRLDGDDDENWLKNVVLSLAPDQKEVIMSLSKNMNIKATGKCSSTDLFDDIKIENVKIDTSDIKLKETESTQPTQPDEIIDVDIDDLLEEYENNSVSADSKYKDKTLRVKGKIGSIEDGYIRIEGTDSWEFRSIYVYYDYDEDVSSLKKGNTITVKGICKGEGIFSDIELKKCTIEK